MPAPHAAGATVAELAKAAVERMKAKDWDAAVNRWVQCLDGQGKAPRADHQAMLAECYLASKRFQEARLLIDNALTTRPFEHSLIMQRATLAYLERDYRAAIESWCICLGLNPESVTLAAFKRLAECFRRTGEWVYARSYISQGLQRFPNAPILFAEWAQTEEDAGQLQRACELWEQTLECYRGAAPVSFTLSSCRALEKNQQLQRCAEILETALLKHPSDPRVIDKLKDVRAAERVVTSVIAESAGNYRFTYYRQKQGAEIVFFTFGTINTGFSSPAFGYPFLLSEGYDHVHVAQEPKQQYQGLSLDEFATIAAPLCAGKKAFTYGSSLGGYAAIYFASAIGACAIASSPTLPAHAMAKRFPRHKIPIKHTPIEEFSTPHKVYAFFDPHDDEDETFIRLRIAPACKDLATIPLPFSGHQALRILVEAGLLKQTIKRIVEEMPATLSISEDRIEHTSIYLEEYAYHLLRKGQHRQALEVGKQCLGKGPRLRAFNVVIRGALKLGEIDVAARYHVEALTKFPAEKLAKLPVTNEPPPVPDLA